MPGLPRIRVFPSGAERGVPLTCFQCHDAACLDACASGALRREAATGAIVLQEECCVRCGMCVAACPFGNMTWDDGRRVAKCDLCGGAPRCVAFCSTRALEYAQVPDPCVAGEN
jgi:Fe-S-cluster-containing hydrogenase component 2